MSTKQINSLSLLAHKVAPNIFDLSSEQINVSIRDQIVRAQRLILDINNIKNTTKNETQNTINKTSLLVVGMGVAGVAAAMMAKELNFTNVVVLETKSKPFSLFENCTNRYIGPYMYEWPSSFHNNQSYPEHSSTPWQEFSSTPLVWNSKKPIPANTFHDILIEKLTAWYEDIQNKNSIKFITDVDEQIVTAYIKNFANGATSSSNKPVLSFKNTDGKNYFENESIQSTSIAPDYIILAAGMGTEKTTINGMLNGSPSFWKMDNLKDSKTANKNIIIVGGGDGAIQDAFRALINYNHPLEFIQHLEKDKHVRFVLNNIYPHLISADRQQRQHNSWSTDNISFEMIDNVCKNLAKKLSLNKKIRNLALKKVRNGTGSVKLIIRHDFFEKAYLLNRFVIYLIDECMKKVQPSPKGKMTFKIITNTELNSATLGANNTWTISATLNSSTGITYTSDEIVIRFGIDNNSIPGKQLLHLKHPKRIRHLTSLKKVEQPFVTLR